MNGSHYSSSWKWRDKANRNCFISFFSLLYLYVLIRCETMSLFSHHSHAHMFFLSDFTQRRKVIYHLILFFVTVSLDPFLSVHYYSVFNFLFSLLYRIAGALVSECVSHKNFCQLYSFKMNYCKKLHRREARLTRSTKIELLFALDSFLRSTLINRVNSFLLFVPHFGKIFEKFDNIECGVCVCMNECVYRHECVLSRSRPQTLHSFDRIFLANIFYAVIQSEPFIHIDIQAYIYKVHTWNTLPTKLLNGRNET